jgi:hypothetical protein
VYIYIVAQSKLTKLTNWHKKLPFTSGTKRSSANQSLKYIFFLKRFGQFGQFYWSDIHFVLLTLYTEKAKTDQTDQTGHNRKLPFTSGTKRSSAKQSISTNWTVWSLWSVLLK